MNLATTQINELRQRLPWVEAEGDLGEGVNAAWSLNDEMWVTEKWSEDENGNLYDFEVFENGACVLSITGFATSEEALLAGSVVWWLTYLLSNAQPVPNGKSPWMDAEEAAEVLGVHVVTLRRLIRTGELELPVLKVGRRLKVLRKAIDP